MTASDLELAQDAHAATLDELYTRLGQALTLPGDRDGASSDPAGDTKNWLERNRDALKNLLCANAAFQTATDNAADIAAVADLIAATYSKPAAFTLAAILIKHGRTWLCG